MIQKLKVRELAEAAGTSMESMVKILDEKANLKIGAAFANNRSRNPTSSSFTELFGPFYRNPRDFLRRLVTIDKTWIHHYIPEWVEHAKQWVGSFETAPKRVKTQQSARKVVSHNT